MKKVIFILFHCSLSLPLFQQVSRMDFPDVLMAKHTVLSSSNITQTFFSDQGAWFAYCLPSRPQDCGGFIGPLIMEYEGKWLANSFAQLSISEGANPINLSAANIVANYYPGLLRQSISISNLKIQIDLIFTSKKEALVQTSITNTAPSTRIFTIEWKGTALLNSAVVSKSNNRVSTTTGTVFAYVIDFISPQLNYNITNTSKTYNAQCSSISVASNTTIKFLQSHKYYPGAGTLAPTSNGFDTEFNSNEARWNLYLNNYFKEVPTSLSWQQKKLAVKCIETLTTNWRGAAGAGILHDGVFPSASYNGFYGVWSWDSWKQAVGMIDFNIDLAKENILCLFDHQTNEGMIPDYIDINGVGNNRDTKPPLSAWAVNALFKKSQDLLFLKNIYPKLCKYHNWWYTYRDHDKDSLCEYGSTDGTLIAAKWESGMDNAVRFDNCSLLSNGTGAWSLNQESVDLNAYLYKEKIYLADMAGILGIQNEKDKFLAEAARLKIKINSTFYSPAKGFYYDRGINSGNFSTVEGPEGWIPLWAGVAGNAEATQVKNMMSLPNKFNTFMPLPTLCADATQFNPANGYWRGPVWVDQFYFGVSGLYNYGFQNTADQMISNFFSNTSGLFTEEPIRENYNPTNGNGLNANNFSWSSAHILMLLKGITSGTTRIPANEKKNGLLSCIYPNPTATTLYIDCEEVAEGSFNLSIADTQGKIVREETMIKSDSPLAIDITMLMNGTYLITIEGKGFIKTEKIIIQH